MGCGFGRAFVDVGTVVASANTVDLHIPGTMTRGSAMDIDLVKDMHLVEFRFSAYRRLRRGLVSLPVVEAQLEADLQKLAGVLKRGTSTQFELFFVAEIIQSVKELVDETVVPLMALRQHFDADPFFGDLGRMKDLASKNLKDKELEGSIIRALEDAGGLQSLLKSEHERLERKQKTYATTMSLLGSRDVQSTLAAIGSIVKAREDERGRLQAIMSNKTPAYRDAIATELAIGQIFGRLTATAPAGTASAISSEPIVAALLPVLVLIVIGCALLCAHD
jgi:hypothetical protein